MRCYTHIAGANAATLSKDTLNPYFGQLWEGEIELPGGTGGGNSGSGGRASSQLEVTLEDHELLGETLGRNQVIGSTLLDLEARYLAFKRGKGSLWWETQQEFRHAPIERLPLYLLKPCLPACCMHAFLRSALWVGLGWVGLGLSAASDLGPWL